jgi:hypothetical protein
MMNVYFAMYAWNASPIDGTDIVRSFAAKACTFNFPLDVQKEPVRLIGNPSERSATCGDDVLVMVLSECIT